jgi:Domain of unknown function (DUF4352)
VCLAAWSGCAPAQAPEVIAHRMGERVPVGSFVYNVFDDQWKTELGEGSDARIPKDRFFLVHMSVVNGGSADYLVPTTTLVDDSGVSYTELSNGDQAPAWLGFLRRAKPAETLQGDVVFDVPPKHYRLRVGDENDEKHEEIDIPLSFSDQTPQITQPGQ